MHQLDLGPVQLVGHSLGGWLAAQVALHHAQAIRAVTVLDPPATFADLRPRFVVAGLVAVLAPSRRVRRGLLGWIAGSTVAGPLGELGLTALETFRGTLPPPRRPDPSRLTDLTMPASVVVAGRSTVHTPKKVARAARSAGWRVEVWSGVGHDLAGAPPEQLADTVSATLSAAESGGGA
ncbi:alpha/beta fold hydrolase [Nocardioides sp. TF02-7]|nr:alpha/beta fold hydrolase [Nocardioides sp. TF02-7]